MMFRADVEDGKAQSGIESLETQFVHEQDIPWEDLAFPIINETLELYFQDRKRGEFGLHTGEITRKPDRTISTVRY